MISYNTHDRALVGLIEVAAFYPYDASTKYAIALKEYEV